VRLLVLSDVHANLEAAEACLEAAPAYDLAVDLGDIVGYGASPNEVVARLRPLCRLHVRGNHDKAAAGLTGLEGFNPIAAAAAEWTRHALTPSHLAWLRTLPPGPAHLPEIKDVLWVHGSPLGEDEYLIGMYQAVTPLLQLNCALAFFGHTHLQGGFCLEGDFCREILPGIDPGNAPVSAPFDLSSGAKYLINPGSVGQPRDGDWRAAFALFDSDRRTVTFHRVPYDLARCQQRIRAAGLPERLAGRLALGR
jgi:diadenosine tetraphosphatase ApaH/serine/threonine PP2A family protein phosphatase